MWYINIWMECNAHSFKIVKGQWRHKTEDGDSVDDILANVVVVMTTVITKEVVPVLELKNVDEIDTNDATSLVSP